MNENKIIVRAIEAECRALRQYATTEEKQRLVEEVFNPYEYNHCIYGLMTRNCYSQRASELIERCAEPLSFLDVGDLGSLNPQPADWTALLARRQLYNQTDIYSTPPDLFSVEYTALESFIVWAEENNLPEVNGRILAFIRGDEESFPDLEQLLEEIQVAEKYMDDLIVD